MTAMNTNYISREIFKKSMILQGIPRSTIESVLKTKGVIKDCSDLKMLLDLGSDLEEIDKQCIINRCYRITNISLIF